jgi:hypothetical protein
MPTCTTCNKSDRTIIRWVSTNLRWVRKVYCERCHHYEEVH